MIIQRKAANAIAAKTARPCDSCVRKRARWYCAADDAFLCQVCDASVHSANQLAGRHDRVRLTTASFKPSIHLDKIKLPDSPISDVCHQGFTRKARTPRNRKDKREDVTHIFPLVSEIGNEELCIDDNEEQLLYCVPVFDPFSIELCNSSSENVMPQTVLVADNNTGHNQVCDLGNIPVILPSDTEIDMESLLGTGIDEGSCGIEGLGLLDCKQEDIILFDINIELENNKLVKVEEEFGEIIGNDLGIGFDVARETINWNFGYESPMAGDEEECEKAAVVGSEMMPVEVLKHESRDHTTNFLKINYENVIKEWDDECRCPWINGIRPERSTGIWPEFMGITDNGGRGSDGGREARVTRYREKRRNRLFSKKIRYEVRKLNADKRPRMKGRFVKRV